MADKKEILVYTHWVSQNEPVLMGTLTVTPSRGKEIFSFEYSKNWLQTASIHLLDPDLQFYEGRFYPREGKPNFGIFLDSCPDRWGRTLMDKRESLFARKENRPHKNLNESDYLLGVYDEHRMGALRYKLADTENFLNDDK